MLFFVVADFFRRRRRPRGYARDELPTEPLLSVLTLWLLVFFGGCFAAVAISAVVATAMYDIDLDRLSVVVSIVLALLSPVCLSWAVVVWRKLTR